MLAPIPPDPEPSAEELAGHMDAKSNRPDFVRDGMARILWRMQKAQDDPNAFLVGFASEVSGYTEYLTSALWRRIRRRVLKAANYECACCPNKATQVHHRDYRPRVLDGDDDSMLVALCKACHEAIHTSPDGRRRDCWNDVEADLQRRVAAKSLP